MLVFLTLWFFISYRILKEKRREVELAAEQVRVYDAIYRQKRDTVNAETARRMVDTSHLIYKEALNSYLFIYSKPIYKLPGYLMGFSLGK